MASHSLDAELVSLMTSLASTGMATGLRTAGSRTTTAAIDPVVAVPALAQRGSGKPSSRSPASSARSPGSSSATPAPGSKSWDRIVHPRSPARRTRDKIREIERLNPGKKVILAPIDAEADTAA